MFGIDERCDPAELLGFGDGVQRQRGLAGGFRPEQFGDSASRDPGAAQSDIQRQRTRADAFDLRVGVLVHLHDGALTVLLLDLCDHAVQSSVLAAGALDRCCLLCFCHWVDLHELSRLLFSGCYCSS